MKKYILTTIICLASLFSFAQTEENPNIINGVDISKTILTQWPQPSSSIKNIHDTRIEFTIQNKVAILEVMKSLDFKNKNYVILKKWRDTDVQYAHVNVPTTVHSAYSYFIQFGCANETEVNAFTNSLNTIISVRYYVTHLTDVEWEEFTKTWTIKGHPELVVNPWIRAHAITIKKDKEAAKALIDSGILPLRKLWSQLFFRPLITDEEIYNELASARDLTEEEIQLKNRIFINLYQKKMLGK